MSRLTQRRRVVHVDGDVRRPRPDDLVVEEPLEIRVGGQPVAVTMRTPGHDLELALGFLITEGLASTDTIRSATSCADNVVDVELTAEIPDTASRAFYVNSSCGLCGKTSIDALRTVAPWKVVDDIARLDPAILIRLPDLLRESQRTFERTGGLHAAGLFTNDGELLCAREDVGRHNAVDKVVGWAASERHLPLRSTVLQVSGRASFELVQKALMAGIPVLSAVSAPSSLAVELAADAGMTLIGFLRGSSFNVYTDAGRLAMA